LRILKVSNIYPSGKNIYEAANMVSFEIMAGLADKESTKVGFLKVGNDENYKTEELDALNKEYGRHGIEILPIIDLPNRGNNSVERNIIAKIKSVILLEPLQQEFYYPILRFKELIYDHILKWDPDVVIVTWDESVTALLADLPVKVKYAYYGNPDAKSFLARIEFLCLLGNISPARRMLKKIFGLGQAKILDHFNVQNLKKYDLVGNVAMNDVLYYRERHLNHVHYVRNLWATDDFKKVLETKKRRELSHNKIVANVGNVGGTANTLGLDLLGREFIPELKKQLGRGNFEICICGGGMMSPQVEAELKKHDEVKILGFVDDIDLVIQEAKIVLTLNNASYFKVGHTRYLHAWSLGTVNIAHFDASLSMPELMHDLNILMGKSISDIVHQVVRVLDDKDLREKIALMGFETLERLNNGKKVSAEIYQDMKNIYQQKITRMP